jgi:hypothetical protein
MPTPVKVPCAGNSTRKINKMKDTVIFSTDAKCSPFKSFDFVGNPPCFNNRNPPAGGGDTISYDYDGSPIPENGYTFEYVTSGEVAQGNGTGVIKNN